MMRRPPRSTRVRSSAASDVYKRVDHPKGVVTGRGGGRGHDGGRSGTDLGQPGLEGVTWTGGSAYISVTGNTLDMRAPRRRHWACTGGRDAGQGHLPRQDPLEPVGHGLRNGRGGEGADARNTGGHRVVVVDVTADDRLVHPTVATLPDAPEAVY